MQSFITYCICYEIYGPSGAKIIGKAAKYLRKLGVLFLQSKTTIYCIGHVVNKQDGVYTYKIFMLHSIL